ncbi:MAG: heavy-metal-associated domain-containing protein [Flavobacteriales bacterium]|nr:heavy-metal-associated domain-containing protein [Flavobacteriales bacterium]
MSLINDNVIPGDHGTIFETNAKEEYDLNRVKMLIEQVEGVKDVIVNKDGYPYTLTVHTSKLVKIIDIENEAKKSTFHVIPKSTFSL